MMPEIRERAKADVTKLEGTLWTAMTSARPGEAIFPLLAPQCVLHFPNSPMLASDTNPSIQEILTNPDTFKRWDQYGMGDMRIIILDLMAAVVCYRVQASRDGTVYRALCATTWRQDSDGEWRICCHAQTPSDY
jgi:hypothetical protein